MIHYIIYKSKKVASLDSKGIENILETSRKNNIIKSISGLLVHSDDNFLQYIEASNKEVLHILYDTIEKDTRHKDVKKLKSGEVEARLFPSWNMAFRSFENDDIELMINHGTKVNNRYLNLFDTDIILSQNYIDLVQEISNLKYNN